MRVIAGKARRLVLKTIEGQETRPTTDRIKETLFNMIQGDLPGCCFLDLFSGSGAIGIEALSRGAGLAVLVEQNPKAAECIRENLKTTKLEDDAIVMNCDVMTGLGRLEGKGHVFDLVFMDPPYQEGWEKRVLQYLADSPLIHEDTTIIVEAALETSFDYLEEMGYRIKRIKDYKTNKHVFVSR
ncbi:16S rRNA (guanine(966)-N(2))-methyltransferase RsmD [Lacrimispora saccharolytica]|uniref:Methyltransferase n=1 Tax=Lacrimispora saccharolytica (strain ATCC 35040 / DSM 2544 / NRCC 2533 / WM1) TaxID=610130 RepID=D9R0Z6_LACSW|nr:16S rRNA (guanine(966)-N(2))-methyltransferase RsmD [Lacrimispora saccharolytica]ADL04543.1 methyltransferase [[Clostridium] saccharolyticum WM1]QRV21206.1 16S rRNA (guanine(966)-N(2))-methyltransferase RsmD [Lacrimispora saccharolytica]